MRYSVVKVFLNRSKQYYCYAEAYAIMNTVIKKLMFTSRKLITFKLKKKAFLKMTSSKTL